MSSQAFRDYRVGGPPFLAVVADGERPDRGRGLGRTPRPFGPRGQPSGRAGDRIGVPCRQRVSQPVRDALGKEGGPPSCPNDTRSARPRRDQLTIDCDCCALQGTDACDDCVVSFLLGREPDDAVVIDADEARAMRMLERAGLVPTLRFSNQAGLARRSSPRTPVAGAAGPAAA